MDDQRIRLITDPAEAERLGVRVGDHVRVPDPVPPLMISAEGARHNLTDWHQELTGPLELDHYDGPSDTVVTAEEIEAASLAYVQARFAGEADQWRRSFPEAWREITERMRVALIAAAAVRAS